MNLETKSTFIDKSFFITLLFLVFFSSFSHETSVNLQPHKINWFLTSKTGKDARVQCFTATTSGHLVVGGTFTENLYLYPNVNVEDQFVNGTKANETEPSASFLNTSPYSLTRESLFVIKLNESDGTILWQYSIDCETNDCKFYDVGVSSDYQKYAFVFLSAYVPLSNKIHPFSQPGGPLFFVFSLDDGTLQWNTQYLCYSKDCYNPFSVLVKGDEVYVSGRGKEDTYLSYGSFKVYRDANANNELVSNSFVQAFRRKSNSYEMEPLWTFQTHNTNSTAYVRIYQATISNTTMYLSGYYSGTTTWLDRKQKNFTIIDNVNVDFHSFYILKFDTSGNILDLWTNTSYRFDLKVDLYSKQIGNDQFVTSCMDNEGLKSFTCITLLDDKKLKYYSSYNSEMNHAENFDRPCERVQVYSISGISKDLYLAMRCLYKDKSGRNKVEYKVNVRSITNYRKGEWQVSYIMYGNYSSMALQRHEDTKSVNVLITTDGYFTESISNYTFHQDHYAFTLFEIPFMYPFTFCFGISSNDSSVCSSHGVCIYTNECECNPGWGYPNCQFPVCGDFVSNDTRVCSGVGNCTQPGLCECPTGFTGQYCEYPICFGKRADDSLVCSGTGKCISPNICDCPSGFTGNECQYPICFGKSLAYNSSLICNGHGNCSQADNCECETGWKGTECQYPVCFGKIDNNSSIIMNNGSLVCSGNGKCILPNICNCEENYEGLECQIPLCYNISALNESVCTNSNGSCTSPNTCQCYPGRSGLQCEHWKCFNYGSDSPLVCSGHGQCIGFDSCNCSQGYQGPSCQYAICYGIGANESAVCNSKGNCTKPDYCSCENGKFVGLDCEQPVCFGIPSNNSNVCNNLNGTCVEPNLCVCNSKYGGSDCSIPICFGTLSNNRSVCSGYGSCLAPDTCECNFGFFGERCQFTTCFELSSDASNVCYGHGKCITKDTCLCDTDYTGSQCEFPKCNEISANKTNVCNSQGVCFSPNVCKCNSGFLGQFCELFTCNGIPFNDSSVCNHGNGTCLGKDNCKCISGYKGKYCQDRSTGTDLGSQSETGWIIGITVSVPISFVMCVATIGCCVIYCYNSRRWNRKNTQEKEVHRKLMEMSLTAEHLEGQDSPFHLLRPSLGDYRELDEFSDPASISSSLNMSSSGNTANNNSSESAVAVGIKSITESKIFIPYKDLEFEKKLGSGSGGEVYKAKWKQNQVAVKKVEELESFLKEVTLLHNLKHPNIITIYGVSFLQGYYLIVMEFMTKGSLESFLYQLRIGSLPNIKLSDKISILLDISKGMDYLHSLKPPIIHRDLKPGNVLMDNSNKCKVADFGLSRALTKNTNLTNNLGTLFYMHFEENGNSMTTDTATASDVYSFAIICWEIFFEENPYIYQEKNRKKLFREIEYETSEYKKVENNSFKVPALVSLGIRPIIPFSTLLSCKEWCEEYLGNEKSKYEIVFSFIQLVKYCWDSSPSNRPNFSEITQKLMAFEELLNK